MSIFIRASQQGSALVWMVNLDHVRHIRNSENGPAATLTDGTTVLLDMSWERLLRKMEAEGLTL